MDIGNLEKRTLKGGSRSIFNGFKSVQYVNMKKQLTGCSLQAIWLLVKRKRKLEMREAGPTKDNLTISPLTMSFSAICDR